LIGLDSIVSSGSNYNYSALQFGTMDMPDPTALKGNKTNYKDG